MTDAEIIDAIYLLCAVVGFFNLANKLQGKIKDLLKKRGNNMDQKKTYYIVKSCNEHNECHGWAAMDIGEDVGWLPEWLESAASSGFNVKFMAEIPNACQHCKSKKEKKYEH